MIVVRIYEGLGNQMFEYAYAYALSQRMKKRNIKVYLDMREEDATLYDRKRMGRPLAIGQFNISLPVADHEILRHWDYIADKTIMHRIIHCIRNIGVGKYRVVWEDEFNYRRQYLQIRDYSYVGGWFQHYQYFEKYRKRLLSEFTLREKWDVPLQLKQIMEEYQAISLHVRRGDYITNPYARKVLPACNKNYYINAVEYLKLRVINPFLFIFTNDERWVRDNLHFDIPSILITNHYDLSDIQEMILMSRCKHNIIANSTFSWWGAWLNRHEEKIVIAPKRWFSGVDRKNIAMGSWVTM